MEILHKNISGLPELGKSKVTLYRGEAASLRGKSGKWQPLKTKVSNPYYREVVVVPDLLIYSGMNNAFYSFSHFDQRTAVFILAEEM